MQMIMIAKSDYNSILILLVVLVITVVLLAIRIVFLTRKHNNEIKSLKEQLVIQKIASDFKLSDVETRKLFDLIHFDKLGLDGQSKVIYETATQDTINAFNEWKRAKACGFQFVASTL